MNFCVDDSHSLNSKKQKEVLRKFVGEVFSKIRHSTDDYFWLAIGELLAIRELLQK